MNKDEILEVSRKENKKKDYARIEVENQACRIAVVCTLLLAFIYYTYEIVSGKGQNYALYSIITLFNAIMFGYRGLKVKENNKLNLFSGIIWSILTVALILQYFKVI